MEYRKAAQKRIMRDLMFNKAVPKDKSLKSYVKVSRKCVREDCTNETTHNGGYCSSGCCHLDRAQEPEYGLLSKAV